VAQDLVLGWLRDIAGNGERFRELQAQGRERLGRQLGELRAELGKRDAVLSGLREQIEARIRELTRTKAEAARDSIEKSIVGLERERKEAEERQALLVHSKAELESLVAQDRDLFADYRRRIRDVLRKEDEELKDSLAALVSSLLLEETSIKIALVSINRTGLRSSVLLSSPRSGVELPIGWLTPNSRWLIEDAICFQVQGPENATMVTSASVGRRPYARRHFSDWRTTCSSYCFCRVT
jgi:hypothetical protein